MGKKFCETSSTNPNDAAFSSHVGGTLEDGNGDTFGLTKGEYFAAMAMQGCLAATAGSDQWPTYSDTSNRAVQYADALIESLNKEIG